MTTRQEKRAPPRPAAMQTIVPSRVWRVWSRIASLRVLAGRVFCPRWLCGRGCWSAYGGVAPYLGTRALVLPPLSGHRPGSLQASMLSLSRSAGYWLSDFRVRFRRSWRPRQGGGVHRREHTGRRIEKAARAPPMETEALWRRHETAVADRFQPNPQQNEKVPGGGDAGRDTSGCRPFGFAWAGSRIGAILAEQAEGKDQLTSSMSGAGRRHRVLGAYRADRAKHAVRLVTFRQGRTMRRYITNVHDPSRSIHPMLEARWRSSWSSSISASSMVCQAALPVA